MTSKHAGRQDCRPKPRPLKPEERAGLHRVALAYRAAYMAAKSGAAASPATAIEPETDEEADRRARYAAALARAEFGRFYWKEEPAGRTQRPK